RVPRGPIESNLIVKMRRSRPAGAPRPADDRASLDVLSYLDIKTRQMRVVSRNAAAVVHYDHVSVAVIPAHKLDRPGIACAHRVTPPRLYVDSSMKLVPACERIAAHAKSTAYADARGRLLFIVVSRAHGRGRYRDRTCASLYNVWRRRYDCHRRD